MNRWLRQLHRYLGVFFAPLLLLYIATGWWQTVTVNRNKGLGFGKSWIERQNRRSRGKLQGERKFHGQRIP